MMESDVALKTFMTSTRELKNSKSTDIGAIGNVCNPERTVNVATVYLAKALGLDVRSLVEDYTYNWATSHSFPMNSTHGPSQTFEPTGDNAQAYWTVLDHYTTDGTRDKSWQRSELVSSPGHWRPLPLSSGLENCVHTFCKPKPPHPDGIGLRYNLCHC